MVKSAFVVAVLIALSGADVLAEPTPQLANHEAGPIWNQADAQAKCPVVCSAHGRWTGQWRTTVPGTMSVCECAAAGAFAPAVTPAPSLVNVGPGLHHLVVDLKYGAVRAGWLAVWAGRVSGNLAFGGTRNGSCWSRPPTG